MRPSWDEIWMDFACNLAKRSTCRRSSVGCVIVSMDSSTVLGLGYNGGPKGLNNDCISDEPGKCFSGGVQVTTKQGQKRIKKIREGDLVLTHLNRYRRVVRVIKSKTATRDFALIKFNGGRNGRFISTADHPVYVKRDGNLTWVPAKDIRMTDLIVSLAQDSYEEITDGFVGLNPKSIEIVQRTCPVYNLEVEEDHTYVCQGVSVHNCGHLHAEINALIKFNYRDSAEKRVYLTLSPCYNCAVALVNAGVTEVVFQKLYRDPSGVKLLESAGIKVREFDPNKEKTSDAYLNS